MQTSCKHGYIIVSEDNNSAVLDTYTASLYHSPNSHVQVLAELKKRNEEQLIGDFSYPENNNILRQLVINCADCCNLKCTYCYANEGTYNQDKHIISFLELKNIYDNAISIFSNGIYSINFFGGEPLLGACSIIEFCEYVRQDAAIKKHTNPEFVDPIFSIITNGTLIDERIAPFLEEFDFSIVVSLDGPEEINNLCRVSDHISNVYKTVSDNLELLKNHNVSFSCECTLTDSFLDIYKPGYMNYYLDSLFDLGFAAVACVLERKNRPSEEITQRKTTVKKIFTEIVDYTFQNLCSDNLPNRYPLSVLKTIQSITKNRQASACRAGQSSIFSNWRGDVYPCQAYYSAGKDKMGNIISQANKILLEMESFVPISYSDIESCRACPSYGYCSILCPGSSLQFFNDKYRLDPLGCCAQQVMFSRCIYNLANLSSAKYNKLVESFLAEITNKKRWIIAHEG